MARLVARTELNINECTDVSQLTVLPGVGEKFAAVILNEKSIRPFQSTKDLVQRVKGLSKKKLSKMTRKFVLKFDLNINTEPAVTAVNPSKNTNSGKPTGYGTFSGPTQSVSNLRHNPLSAVFTATVPLTSIVRSPGMVFLPMTTLSVKPQSEQKQMENQQATDKASMFDYLTTMMEYDVVEPQSDWEHANDKATVIDFLTTMMQCKTIMEQ